MYATKRSKLYATRQEVIEMKIDKLQNKRCYYVLFDISSNDEEDFFVDELLVYSE